MLLLAGGPLESAPRDGSPRSPPGGDGGPLGPAIAGGTLDSPGPVLGWLAGPEFGVGVDPSGPLGAVMAGSPPVFGCAAAVLPPESADGPLDEELPLVEEDGPESLGDIDDDADEPESLELPELLELLDDGPESLGSIDDEADEPESLELLELLSDAPESLGDIGAGPGSSITGVTAFAAPAPPQSNPTPSPVANAVLTTRWLILKVRLRVRPPMLRISSGRCHIMRWRV